MPLNHRLTVRLFSWLFIVSTQNLIAVLGSQQHDTNIWKKELQQDNKEK